MNTPLAMIEQEDAHFQWQRFVERRNRLEDQMQLTVCDGCDGCGGRCTAGFLVTLPEWEAAIRYYRALPEGERKRLEAQERTVAWPGAEDTGATVTYCTFRDREHQRCAIYPERPTICRLFGQVSWLPCPIEAVTAYPTDAAGVWNAYRQEKRKTWEEWQEEESTREAANN